MMGRGGRGGGGGRGSGPDAMGDGLARQPSIYSMTFDEFQSTLGGIGKDFGSMNMDEFLKNIWTAEESHAMADASAGLPRQGSLTLPRTLSQKTVDEVWRDLICPPEQGPPPPPAGVLHQCPQLTLREMTLEEFLVRAGVVREELAPPSAALPQRRIGNSCNSGSNNTTTSSVLFGDRSVANNASGLALGFAQASRNSRDVLTTNPIANSVVANLAMMAASGPSPYVAPLPSGNGVVEMGNPQGIRGGGLVGIGDSGMSSGLMPGAVGLGAAGVPVPAGTPANHLPSDALRKGGEDVQSALVPYVFSEGIRGRKSTAVEKVLERRQRRMIKNRESAARSRARKQAYTMELEAEVEKLKELNQELQKKQVELMEMQKNRIMYGFLDQPVTKREAGILKKRKGLGDD